jgi:hypothetical protein
LATIYYRKDNPFTNIDSAFRYIQLAESSYISLKSKQRDFYKEMGVDYQLIVDLRANISTRFFELARKEHTVLSYSRFIEIHPWAQEVHAAVYSRDSIAFEQARGFNSSTEYMLYMQTYPNSTFYKEANQLFYLRQYKEFTKSNTVVSFMEFLVKYPDNPYKTEAEDMIFKLTTEEGNMDAFHAFILKFPTNRNVGTAWKNIYQLYMREYSEDRIATFISTYPDYPYKDQLEQDAKTQKMNLLPFMEDGQFGYIDFSGKVILKAEYEQLGVFKEGLASAAKNGKYGFIDKSWKTVIPFQYESVGDFESGRALVELDGKYGMIDRLGEAIFPIEYNDLGTVSEELIYAQKDSLYGYYDKNANQRIAPRFEEAFPFQNGFAKVVFKGKQAIIDAYGTFIVPPAFDEVAYFNDSLLVYSEDGSMGLCRKNCEVVVPAQYSEIGALVQDRAMVVKEGKIGYIDGTGKIILNCVFETFPNYLIRGQYNAGLVLLKHKGKFGLSDKTGKIIVPMNFFNLGDVSSLIAFQSEKGWGYMDLNTKVLINPIYQYAESFQDGFAIVEKNGMQGVIDVKGVEVIPISFQSVVRLGKKMFQVNMGDKNGIYSLKGEVLVPVVYNDIRVIDKDFIALKMEDDLHYLYLVENKIIKPIR